MSHPSRSSTISTSSLGFHRRLARLFDQQSGNVVVIAMDHGIFSGPVPGIVDLEKAARACAEAGVDALQVGPGGARAIAPVLLDHPDVSLVLRLDTTSAYRLPKRNRTCSGELATLEDAVCVAADAVVMNYLDLPDDPEEERDNLVRISQSLAAARRVAMPMVVEPLVLSGVGESDSNPDAVVRVARMAEELGADLLKVDYPQNDDGIRRLVDCTTVPILLRGGPKTDDNKGLLLSIDRAIKLGVRGVVIGRNAWQVTDVGATVSDIIRAVHGK